GRHRVPAPWRSSCIDRTLRPTTPSRADLAREPVRGANLLTGGQVGTYTVGYFVGSLAKASINRKLARALVRLAPSELQMREIPIGDLPLYSYDYDADYP